MARYSPLPGCEHCDDFPLPTPDDPLHWGCPHLMGLSYKQSCLERKCGKCWQPVSKCECCCECGEVPEDCECAVIEDCLDGRR